MENDEKLALLEEMLELETGDLNENMELAKIKKWDSMAALSLIVLMDDEFGRTLSAEQIREFVTVKDILDYMS